MQANPHPQQLAGTGSAAELGTLTAIESAASNGCASESTEAAHVRELEAGGGLDGQASDAGASVAVTDADEGVSGPAGDVPRLVPPEPSAAPAGANPVDGEDDNSSASPGLVRGLAREERFEVALSCRAEGNGAKPQQGCASAQLNSECKEGTRTPEFAKYLEVIRATADAEVVVQFGTNADNFDRADYLQVERPLFCTCSLTRSPLNRGQFTGRHRSGARSLRD